ncbi:BBS10 protein, partial [Centropus bengalensis]|nr:BBS10 protein [Centropus bengalensis]
SEAQYRAARRWGSRSARAAVERLRGGGVGLLLSSVKQDEELLHCARLLGVSVVEGLSEEEVALVREIAGLSPHSPSGDGSDGEIMETALVTFCRPLVLGSRRYAHVGLAGAGDFQPHCLVLCGPVDAVIEQHAAALQGALTMLQQLCKSLVL